MKMVGFSFKSLGPGLLFAGAAIGVSHLVQATRAGAEFGFGLVWAILIVHLFKYPFFRYGPAYAMASGESLVEGYYRLGKAVLGLYFVLTFLTMFSIQAAVTLVTAGMAISLFGLVDSVDFWCILITVSCTVMLFFGRYKLLDMLIKSIILVLTVSTIVAVSLAFVRSSDVAGEWSQILPVRSVDVVFLIALLGWMPAPLDISVWHSIWTLEKQKTDRSNNRDRIAFDFNVGYVATVVLALCFLALGALIMHSNGVLPEAGAGDFARQLIEMYTSELGAEYALVIKIAAFAAMFSTTITTLDASPRAMAKSLAVLQKSKTEHYTIWLLILSVGTLAIVLYMVDNMFTMVKIATIISFLTAPFYAFANYRLVTGVTMPPDQKPGTVLRLLSYLGFTFLIGFSIWYLSVL